MTEAVAELAEVARQMLATGFVIGALHGVLDVAEDGVERLEFRHLHAAVSVAGPHRLVLEAGAGEAAKAGKPVAEDYGIGIEVALGEALGRGLSEAGNLSPCED